MLSGRLNRPLWTALCLSLAFHAFLLFGWNEDSLPPASSLPLPLQVVVGASKPSSSEASVASPEMPVAKTLMATPPAQTIQSVARASKTSEPSPKPERLVSNGVQAQVNTGAKDEEQALTSATQREKSGQALVAEGASASLSHPQSQDAGGGSELNADALREYRIALASAARRFRVYPAQARSRGWEGEVILELEMPARGNADAGIRLARSSGVEVLDDQALSMFSRAVSQTPLPEGLKGRSFRFSVPVRFSLDE